MYNGDRETAEQTWLEIGEFLQQNVSRAAGPRLPVATGAANEIARIVDIMRAIESDDGVRGQLARLLTAQPAGEPEWERMRSLAAIVAESGNLLLARQPPKGSLIGWRERAIEFRGAAEMLFHAIEQKDLLAAQDALRRLPQVCASCHAEYR